MRLSSWSTGSEPAAAEVPPAAPVRVSQPPAAPVRVSQPPAAPVRVSQPPAAPVRAAQSLVEQLSDETLLAGLAAGDERCTVAFVRRFQSRLLGVAVAVLGDGHAAEDVAQVAFERAWRHADSYDPRRGSVVSWLVSIARNAAIDAARVRRPLPIPGEELLARLGPAEGDDPERRAVTGEALGELRAALAGLPLAQARAVVLAGVAGMSASQVAEAEQIPLGTAKTRIRSAMQRLRRALAEPEAADVARGVRWAGGVSGASGD